jgi:hypothetical protein
VGWSGTQTVAAWVCINVIDVVISFEGKRTEIRVCPAAADALGVLAATATSATSFAGALPTLVGLLNLDRAPNDRGFDGAVDAIALSTFTGTFNTSEFVLAVPEPGCLAVVGLSAFAVLKRRR